MCACVGISQGLLGDEDVEAGELGTGHRGHLGTSLRPWWCPLVLRPRRGGWSRSWGVTRRVMAGWETQRPGGQGPTPPAAPALACTPTELVSCAPYRPPCCTGVGPGD